MNATNGGKATDWRAILLAALMGAIGGGSIPVLAPPIVRPDPFMGEEAKALEARMVARLDHAMSRLRLEMRVTLPPTPARERLIHLEEAMRVVKPDFRPPTQLWHDD